MRIRKFIYSAIILFALTSCNKEEEHYESKNVKVDSVFDKADNSKESEADKDKSKNEDKAKEEKKEEYPADDKKAEDDTQQVNKAPDNNTKKYRVENGVNMRSEANTDADNIIAVIDLGTEITGLEEIEQNGKTWVKLEYQGQTGFVVKELLQEVNN